MPGMANAVGLLAVAVVLLVGCATQQTPKATDATSPRHYDRDLYECERQATFAASAQSF